jgi:hypothetical protein
MRLTPWARGLFDAESTSGRDREVLAHGIPDLLGRYAVRERLLDGPAAERGEAVIFGHARGVRSPELPVKESPQIAVPHGRQCVTAATDPEPTSVGGLA